MRSVGIGLRACLVELGSVEARTFPRLDSIPRPQADKRIVRRTGNRSWQRRSRRKRPFLWWGFGNRLCRLGKFGGEVAAFFGALPKPLSKIRLGCRILAILVQLGRQLTGE